MSPDLSLVAYLMLLLDYSWNISFCILLAANLLHLSEEYL